MGGFLFCLVIVAILFGIGAAWGVIKWVIGAYLIVLFVTLPLYGICTSINTWRAERRGKRNITPT